MCNINVYSVVRSISGYYGGCGQHPTDFTSSLDKEQFLGLINADMDEIDAMICPA